MQLILSSAGSYPRIGDAPDLQRHRRAYAQLERGGSSAGESTTGGAGGVARVIREQIEAGMEVVTDGLVRWYDPYSHFCRGLEGATINGLLRLFDTNVYFRQPVVKGPIRRKASVILPA